MVTIGYGMETRSVEYIPDYSYVGAGLANFVNMMLNIFKNTIMVCKHIKTYSLHKNKWTMLI